MLALWSGRWCERGGRSFQRENKYKHYNVYGLSNISCSKFPTTLHQQHNISKPEKSALCSLCTNLNIIILPADKCSMMIVLNKDDYLAEANFQLTDQSTLPATLHFHHFISAAASTHPKAYPELTFPYTSTLNLTPHLYTCFPRYINLVTLVIPSSPPKVPSLLFLH